MTLRRPQVWIGLFSLLAILSVAVVDLGRKSPGPLAAVHGRDPNLSGPRDCSECHGSWGSSMSDACLDCHETIQAQMDASMGLHGMQVRSKMLRCAVCHSEHHGESFALVNPLTFAAAGVPDVSTFDHGLVGFEMAGKHLEQECAECHVQADVQPLPEGALRYGGLSQDCVSCHEDVHEGRMVLSCTQCHTQNDFKELAAPDHDRALPLIGGHAGLACTTCHDKDGPRNLDFEGSKHPGTDQRTCEECHESPHTVPFVETLAQRAGVARGAVCVTCHAAEHESFREPGLSIDPDQHAASGFSVAVPHDAVACADCHDPGREAFGARYPGRVQDDCAACHADPHGGQFGEVAMARSGCIACHDRERFDPPAFGVPEHARTLLPLTGAHLEIDCHACHLDAPAEQAADEGWVRTFHGTDPACEACHADAHTGFFDARLEALARREERVSQGCAECHDTTRFDALPSAPHAGPFDHGAWTGFAIRGAHEQESCEACHAPRDEPDESKRRFGRVLEIYGPFEGCSTCHVDPHGGEFDKAGRPREVGGRAGCARCHDETSFRTLPLGWDHARWTSFALRGVHADLECSDCHAPLARPDANGRTWGKAEGRACNDCHDDPHAGQFAKQGRTDCQRCHSAAASFERPIFDHERDSRFPLGEAHKSVACAACHSTWPLASGLEVVRYKPLKTGCVDCHGVHDEPLLRRKGRKP